MCTLEASDSNTGICDVMVVVVVLQTVSTTTLADSVPLLAGALGVPVMKTIQKLLDISTDQNDL